MVEIERSQNLGDRQRAAQVPGLSVVDHFQHLDAKGLRFGRKLSDQFF
jgi:hypothetical protein